MGTRSTTIVLDEHNNRLVRMYRQYDGYPTGHGQELVDWLSSFDSVVNGIPLGDERKLANGAGCLAAQMVGHFKSGHTGGIYLEPPTGSSCGEEFVYTVKAVAGEPINLKIQGGEVTFFGMPGDEEDEMPVIFHGQLADFNAKMIEDKLYEETE